MERKTRDKGRSESGNKKARERQKRGKREKREARERQERGKKT